MNKNPNANHFSQSESERLIQILETKIKRIESKKRNCSEVGLLRIDKLVLLRVVLSFLDVDSINRLSISCLALYRLIYSPFGLKMVTRVKLKCYSEKISSEVLSKVNNVIKNLQSTRESPHTDSLPKSLAEDTAKPTFYNKFLGRTPKASSGSENKVLESNMRKKFEFEMEKEMESIRALKAYLEEQAEVMRKTLASTENSTKRNLSENKRLLNEKEELRIQLSEMKDNIRQLNNKYQECEPRVA